MKQKLIFIILLLSICSISVAQLKCKVNESFELTSIVFRLAGVKEYVNNDIPGYANDIDKYFTQYNTHKIIAFIKGIREKYHIGYDAVANAAALIEIKNHKVIIKTGCNPEIISTYDSRWSAPLFEQFVSLLDHFYKTTKFNQFFLQHSGLYKIAEERMDKLLGTIAIQWFESFFGEKLSHISIIVSLCNGPKNYAVASNSDNFGIVIGSGADKEGLPFYSSGMVSIIQHEIIHGFTNKCLIQIWDRIDSAALKIYSNVQERMSNQAYSNAKVTISEWLVNLCVLMYFRENPIETPYQLLSKFDMARGFIWMDRSIGFMGYFYKNRKKFRTINDYMPQIAEHINFVADNFADIQKEFDSRHPYVISIFPASYSDVIDTIEIKFSEPMLGAHGMIPLDDEKILSLPITDMPSFKDSYTYIIPIDKRKIQTGRIYGFRLNSRFFQSKKYYPMKKDFIYTFKTPMP